MIRVFYGEITKIDDPEKRGRVKASIPTLTYDFKNNLPREFPYWLEPVFPFAGNQFGYFFIPEIGTTIEIEAEQAKDGVMHGFKWRGCLYSLNQPIPEEFKADYPQRMGIKTKNGVSIIFDDKIKEFIIEATKIRLGDGATEPLVLGTQLQTYLNTTLKGMIDAHIHTGNLGAPTSPPLSPTPTLPGAALSDKVFTEK